MSNIRIFHSKTDDHLLQPQIIFFYSALWVVVNHRASSGGWLFSIYLSSISASLHIKLWKLNVCYTSKFFLLWLIYWYYHQQMPSYQSYSYSLHTCMGPIRRVIMRDTLFFSEPTIGFKSNQESQIFCVKNQLGYKHFSKIWLNHGVF